MFENAPIGGIEIMAGKTSKKKAKLEEPVQEAKQLDHVLVPPVEAATSDDIEALAKGMAVTRDKLPLINKGDAAIAFLKLKAGDVVKFNRKSLVTGQENPYYRLVIGE